MEHMSDQETHLALKGTIERGGKFGHVDCPPVIMEGGLTLKLCPSALCMHPLNCMKSCSLICAPMKS